MPFLVEGLHLFALVTHFGLGLTACLDQSVLNREISHHLNDSSSSHGAI